VQLFVFLHLSGLSASWGGHATHVIISPVWGEEWILLVLYIHPLIWAGSPIDSSMYSSRRFVSILVCFRQARSSQGNPRRDPQSRKGRSVYKYLFPVPQWIHWDLHKAFLSQPHGFLPFPAHCLTLLPCFLELLPK
jgi:hypothetical protein